MRETIAKAINEKTKAIVAVDIAGIIADYDRIYKAVENKKDLFKIAMAIPNVYVASISMGANMMQALKTFKEAKLTCCNKRR